MQPLTCRPARNLLLWFTPVAGGSGAESFKLLSTIGEQDLEATADKASVSVAER